MQWDKRSISLFHLKSFFFSKGHIALQQGVLYHGQGRLQMASHSLLLKNKWPRNPLNRIIL